MNFYNPFREIKELEEIIKKKENEISDLKKEISKITGKNEHKTGFWCTGCKHVIEEKNRYFNCKDRYCKLDMHCEDGE